MNKENEFFNFDSPLVYVDKHSYNKAIDDFAKVLKPILDEKIKGWTNSDDLRKWCENSIDKVAEQLKGKK